MSPSYRVAVPLNDKAGLQLPATLSLETPTTHSDTSQNQYFSVFL